ncbi:MAG: zf-HC2 domain-containing protein [Acidobacteriota bacterium]
MKANINIAKQTAGSDCRFRGQVLDYLYRELDAAETDQFELHLADCYVCTDELAGLSFPRYEVFDWKQKEFDPIQTPEFVFDYKTSVNRSFAAILSSYLIGLKAAFGFREIGFAAAVLTLAFALWAFSPLSGVITNPTSKLSVSLPPVEEFPQIEPQEIADLSRSKDKLVADMDKVADIGKQNLSFNVAVKKPKNVYIRESNHRVNSPGRTETGKIERENRGSLADLELPLSGRNEQNDESLRLSELFEDIGGV